MDVIIDLKLDILFRWIPPYHFYILALLNFMVVQYNWTAMLEYSNKIAPPTLVATVFALNSCFQFMLGKCPILY